MKLCKILLVALMVVGASSVSAQTFDSPASVEGYAWSPNVGWISMSGSNYGVVINPNGRVTGYAWAPHVGWIRFGGLSGCPAGTCAARIDLDTSEFSGWARALNSGNGWDGWISLSAANHGASTYGLEVNNTGVFRSNSYAWGADVTGWINFSTAYVDTPCSNTTTCTTDLLGVETSNIWCEGYATPCTAGYYCSTATNACVAGVDDLVVVPPVVRKGETVTVTWETRLGFYSACRVEGPGGPWSGLQESTGHTSDEINNTGIDFTLYCTDAFTGIESEIETETIHIIADIYES